MGDIVMIEIAIVVVCRSKVHAVVPSNGHHSVSKCQLAMRWMASENARRTKIT